MVWKLDADSYPNDPLLEMIKRERGYNHWVSAYRFQGFAAAPGWIELQPGGPQLVLSGCRSTCRSRNFTVSRPYLQVAWLAGSPTAGGNWLRALTDVDQCEFM